MNNQFDEFAKDMAQSVTRRQALKKFGAGLAGLALACFGLANVAKARKGSCLQSGAKCDPTSPSQCCSGYCAGHSKGYGGKVGPPWKCV